jgi:hypothetical protein
MVAVIIRSKGVKYHAFLSGEFILGGEGRKVGV